jgi:tetratricopeptide (TPR) repeat protein
MVFMKSENLKIGAIIVLIIINYGCATKVSIDVENHMIIAYQYRDEGNWQSARDHYGKALTLAESEGAHERYLAVMNYEYGRALGATCSFKKSEKYLLKALKLEEKNLGWPSNSLSELARLQYDQENYPEAIVYYERDFTFLDKLDAEKTSPIDYADLLIEYSNVLQRTGNSTKAEETVNRAMAIRNNNLEARSFVERTPYGKYCS